MHQLQPVGIVQEPDGLYLYGDVCYENIDSYLSQWESIKTQKSLGSGLIINCQYLLKADSSLVALLIEIRRTCIERDITFTLKHIPDPLERFISVYGLNDFLF